MLDLKSGLNEGDVKSQDSENRIPIADLSLLDLERRLSELELVQIAEWAERQLMDRPNEPVVLLDGKMTIVWTIVDVRRENEIAKDLKLGSPEWLQIWNEAYEKRKPLRNLLFSGRYRTKFSFLSNLFQIGWHELVKNTFDHAKWYALWLAIADSNGNGSFLYREHIWSDHGMFSMARARFGETQNMDDRALAEKLFLSGESIKKESWKNQWVGVRRVFACFGGQGMEAAIHTDKKKVKIINPLLPDEHAMVSESHLPSGIWWIAKSK